MKLSISNIAWKKEEDETVYNWMNELGFSGLEIAPTRIFPESPYTKNQEAKKWYSELKLKHNIEISSIQSIYYQRPEKIFASNEEFWFLLNYTAKAIDFASDIKAQNIAFGCVKNRNLFREEDYELGQFFFRQIADYAYSKNTIIGMEAVSEEYGSNYITDTKSAIELIRIINSEGFKLNLDTGNMLYNKEDIKVLDGNMDLINHVHISEPQLKPIQKREFYEQLFALLKQNNYQNYVSIEMLRPDNLEELHQSMAYVSEIFHK